MRKWLQGLTPIALLFLCAVASKAQSGIIAPARYINWSNAGIVGGLPDASWTKCGATIASYTGTAATINNALAVCGANQYVLLGPGTFNLSTGIALPFNTAGHLVLRGSGSNSTFLNFTGTGGAGCNAGQAALICMQSSDGTAPGNGGNTVVNWTAGYAQGATQITLSSVVGIVVGKTLLALNQCDTGFSGSACTTGSATDNGGYFVCSVLWNGSTGCSVSGPDGTTWRSNAWQQEIVQVTAINQGGCGATCVTISDPLQHPNWASGQSPQAVLIQPVPQDGVENLSIDGTATGSNVGAAITIFNAYQCWVSGVRIANIYAYGVYKLDVAHTQVQNNYFFHSNGHPDAYAVRIAWGSNDLIQNNIFQQWKNSYANDGPGSGEVIAYNFSVDQIVPSPSNQMWASFWTHSAGDDFGLREGNAGDQAQDDNVHGSHLNSTNYRNFFWGWEECKNSTTGGSNCGASSAKDETSVGLVQSSNTRYGADIANVLGTPGVTTTYILTTPFAGYGSYNLGAGGTNSPPTPYDPLVQSTALLWGNWDAVTNAVRWCGNSSDTGWSTTCGSTSEVPTGAPTYPNSVPTLGDTGAGQGALPASFYLASKPAWFGSTPWPAIGPDVTSGNIGQCTGTLNTTNQAGLPATNASQCGSGVKNTAWGGHVNANPAMAAYFAAGGIPDGTGPILAVDLSYSSPGNVTLSPSSQNFGSVNIGSSSSPVTFTVTNGSGATATSITPSTTGGNSGDFTITNSGAGSCNAAGGSLASSGSCTFTATFTPSASGARSTTLSVSYSGGDGASPQTSALSGTGVTPTAATPSCAPGTGTYVTTTGAITCTDSSGGAIICYTTDGSTPATNGSSGCTHGTLYSTTLTFTSTTTLEAIAGGTGFLDSSVVTYVYTITSVVPPPAPPNPLLVRANSQFQPGSVLR